MADSEKPKPTNESDAVATSTGPLVFISHDGRDAQLAEAFAKLLKSVSAGMIKTFRSSDKKRNDGIDFGDEWYKRLMGKLHSTSDVVCLFTERSLDRPWLLFEAGVAKGKLNTPVVGIALGVPLSRVTTGHRRVVSINSPSLSFPQPGGGSGTSGSLSAMSPMLRLTRILPPDNERGHVMNPERFFYRAPRRAVHTHQ